MSYFADHVSYPAQVYLVLYPPNTKTLFIIDFFRTKKRILHGVLHNEFLIIPTIFFLAIRIRRMFQKFPTKFCVYI